MEYLYDVSSTFTLCLFSLNVLCLVIYAYVYMLMYDTHHNSFFLLQTKRKVLKANVEKKRERKFFFTLFISLNINQSIYAFSSYSFFVLQPPPYTKKKHHPSFYAHFILLLEYSIFFRSFIFILF